MWETEPSGVGIAGQDERIFPSLEITCHCRCPVLVVGVDTTETGKANGECDGSPALVLRHPWSLREGGAGQIISLLFLLPLRWSLAISSFAVLRFRTCQEEYNT